MVFLTFSILQLFKNVYAEIKSDIINNLTSDLKLELNIFLNNSADCANELYKRCALTPKIILDYDNAERIKGGITEEILTIAFVEENGTNRTMNLLVELLWELHYTNVLFVYESAQEVSSLTTLFQLCWRNGFVNVLALVNETLYTYQPFPRIKVVALSSLKSYYDKSHLRNFQGYTLRSSISNNAPRVYNYKDINGNSANGGYLYAAVALFLQYYNGTFQEVRMPNYHMNTTVIIKAFENKEIDILPDLLFMYPNYSHSAVVYNYRTLLMAPYAKPLPLNMYILKPMTYFTWLHIVLAICYATLAQMLLSWLCECRVNFGMAFLRTLSSILYLPSYYYGHGSRAQIFCTILLMICSFLLTTLYQSNFTSMIISRLYEPQINSMADIEHTKFSLPMTVEDIAYMSKLSDIPQIIYDRLIEASPMEIDRLIRDFNTSYIYTFNEDKVQYFMYQQKFLRIPRFQVLNEELTQVPLFVSLPCGSPFLKLFNHHLGKIFDTGIFLKMIINCAEEGIFTKDIRFFHTLSIFYEPLKLKHFTPILIVWAFGMLCALICFLIELKMVAWRKEVKRNTQRNN